MPPDSSHHLRTGPGREARAQVRIPYPPRVLELSDAHGHLTMVFADGQRWPTRAATDEEVDGAVSRARDAGVTRILVPSTTFEDAPRAVAIAERHAGVWAAVGIHPHETALFDEDRDLPRLEELCRSAKVVAVGEIGLDYHYDHAPREAQKRALAAQLRLAREKGLPAILHNRLSEADLLAILEAEYPGTPGEPRGVLHSFCADPETGRRAIALGYLVSFSGMITFGAAQNVRDAAAALPLSSMLVETDAPFLAPAPLRGKANEPAFVERTARRLAEVKGVSLEAVAGETTANFRRLFRTA